MAEYRFKGWYHGQSDEPYTYVNFQAATDDEAWGHIVPERFVCAALERHDGEGWDALEISEEEFFGALKDIISGMTALSKDTPDV